MWVDNDCARARHNTTRKSCQATKKGISVHLFCTHSKSYQNSFKVFDTDENKNEPENLVVDLPLERVYPKILNIRGIDLLLITGCPGNRSSSFKAKSQCPTIIKQFSGMI